MSEVEQKPVVEATDASAAPIAEAAIEPLAPTTNTDVEATKPEAAAEAPAVTEPVAAAPAAEKEEEKTIEPVTEGQLAEKGPGLVKTLIPSKKEFWLSDSPVPAENLALYLRGEKPEIAHPVVAWASQTGKGLLFSTKKNADRTHPSDVLALYDATDLKKQTPHEFSFKLNGQNHAFKAASEAERDGWYISIEKAIELGKASKEEIVGSESYKAEAEKLAKPAVVAAAGRATTEEAEEGKKTRGKSPFARFAKKSEKKDEVAEEKKEEEEKTEEPVLASTEAAPVTEAAAIADIPAAQEAAKEDAAPAAVEEKPKPSKRASIFGKLISPTREKSAKEAELKTEAPKDAVVSENPPQLPESTVEPTAESTPAATEPASEAVAEESTPAESKPKGNFLSSFMKRGRSVSPSAALSETKAEETAAPAAEETVATEPVKAEEPAAAEPATEEEAKKETTANKRQSVLGSLGRRASKALNRMQAPNKKETAPATSEATEEQKPSEVKVADNPVVNGTAPEIKPEAETIGDVVPEAVSTGQPAVAASA